MSHVSTKSYTESRVITKDGVEIFYKEWDILDGVRIIY
jgi:hypothetical protein